MLERQPRRGVKRSVQHQQRQQQPEEPASCEQETTPFLRELPRLFRVYPSPELFRQQQRVPPNLGRRVPHRKAGEEDAVPVAYTVADAREAELAVAVQDGGGREAGRKLPVDDGPASVAARALRRVRGAVHAEQGARAHGLGSLRLLRRVRRVEAQTEGRDRRCLHGEQHVEIRKEKY